MNRALFLDRDGVINEDIAYPYLPEHIIFKEDIFDFCKKAQKLGYLLIVITNQAGVARGHYSEEDVKSLHQWMGERLLEKGIKIAAFYYCPFHPEATIEKYRQDSNFRKPKPGMVLQAKADFDINIAQSLVIGDKLSDRIELPGLRSIIIKSNYTPVNFDVEKLSEIESFL
ncbi:MAG: HAD family hydrolase [Chitinivibrionales bacterium]|nr:HAD family hydrolase [Chitinivibrionales bacterium]